MHLPHSSHQTPNNSTAQSNQHPWGDRQGRAEAAGCVFAMFLLVFPVKLTLFLLILF